MKRNMSVICCLMISLIISGCGSGQLFGPTITPTPTLTLTPTFTPTPTLTLTPTLTFTPTPLPNPKQGHWEGVNPVISFDVRNDEVHNFKMEESNSNRTCVVRISTIKLSQTGFMGEKYLLISDAAEINPNEVLLINALGFEIIKGPEGDMIKIYVVNGSWNSETTISGTYSVSACQDNGRGGYFYSPSAVEITWNAKWVSP